MTHRNRTSDDFLSFGDAVVTGANPLPENELENTFMYVQRHAPVSTAMPATLKHQVWNTAVTSANPPRHIRRMRPTLSSVPLTLASVALVAVLILATIQAWQAGHFLQPNGSNGGIDQTRDQTGLAYAPSSQIPATPVATPADAECSGDLTIFKGLDQTPSQHPALWITSAGSLHLLCNGEETELAQNVINVGIVPDTPVAELYSEDGVRTWLNIFTGQTLSSAPFTSSGGGRMVYPNGYGHFQIASLENTAGQYSAVNFATMNSATLQELSGIPFNIQSDLTVATSDDGTTIAVALSQYQSEGSTTLLRQSGAPGDVFVVRDDLSTGTWITVPADMPAINNIAVSPDGSQIAFVSGTDRPDSFVDDFVISIMDAGTGKEVARTPSFERSGYAQVQWANGGQDFVYLTDHEVQRLKLTTRTDETIFQSPHLLLQQPRLPDDSLMHVVEFPEASATPQSATASFSVINLSTGDVTTIAGTPWQVGSSPTMTFRQPWAPIMIQNADQTAYAAFDPRTGKPIPDLVVPVQNDVQLESGGFLSHQYVVTAVDAPVSAIDLGNGTVAIVDMSAETPGVRTITKPEDTQAHQLHLSPSGTILLIGGNEAEPDAPTLALDLTTPDAEWILYPAGIETQLASLP